VRASAVYVTERFVIQEQSKIQEVAVSWQKSDRMTQIKANLFHFARTRSGLLTKSFQDAK